MMLGLIVVPEDGDRLFISKRVHIIVDTVYESDPR